eukprot:scaffold1661_cov251-Pinguiococcus_pyrenoidosus.AAC.14
MASRSPSACSRRRSMSSRSDSFLCAATRVVSRSLSSWPTPDCSFRVASFPSRLVVSARASRTSLILHGPLSRVVLLCDFRLLVHLRPKLVAISSGLLQLLSHLLELSLQIGVGRHQLVLVIVQIVQELQHFLLGGPLCLQLRLQSSFLLAKLLLLAQEARSVVAMVPLLLVRLGGDLLRPLSLLHGTLLSLLCLLQLHLKAVILDPLLRELDLQLLHFQLALLERLLRPEGRCALLLNVLFRPVEALQQLCSVRVQRVRVSRPASGEGRAILVRAQPVHFLFLFLQLFENFHKLLLQLIDAGVLCAAELPQLAPQRGCLAIRGRHLSVDMALSRAMHHDKSYHPVSRARHSGSQSATPRQGALQGHNERWLVWLLGSAKTRAWPPG